MAAFSDPSVFPPDQPATIFTENGYELSRVGHITIDASNAGVVSTARIFLIKRVFDSITSNNSGPSNAKLFRLSTCDPSAWRNIVEVAGVGSESGEGNIFIALVILH